MNTSRHARPRRNCRSASGRALATLRGAGAAATLVLLQGCTAGYFAAQAVPAVMGGVAMASAERRSPFITQSPNGQPRAGADLAALDRRILEAECGDPQSQLWLGSALQNGFNAAPDRIEIYKWFRLAERGGVPAATEHRVVLETSMAAPEIAEAEARASAWQARAEGCPASG